MTPPTLTAIRSRLNNSYTGYSIGCAAAWAALLATDRGLLDTKNWDMLRLGAAGWWGGWLSATIARVGYPPPWKLTEAGPRRLEKVSLVLVLFGFVNFFRPADHGQAPGGRDCGRIQLTRPGRAGGSRYQPSRATAGSRSQTVPGLG